MGAYVGTPADNLTEDPFLKDNPVSQPAPQPGLAPGDPMGAYVGTPADNLTEDPFLQGGSAAQPNQVGEIRRATRTTRCPKTRC